MKERQQGRTATRSRNENEVGKWELPAWMEPYRDLIGGTGGNRIEDLMSTNKENMCDAFMHAAFMFAVDAQIDLLHRLKAEGLLLPRHAALIRPGTRYC
jgi:hypothetical protein